MKIKNVGKSDFSFEEIELKPGQYSQDLDDILARELVSDNPGRLVLVRKVSPGQSYRDRMLTSRRRR